MSDVKLHYTAEKWEEIRQNFSMSLMVDTKLSALAENMDVEWPIPGEEETPSKYIEYTWGELTALPEMAQPERINRLCDILLETLSFDDPFGEMVEHVDSSSQRDDTALRTLKKLEIPLDYPVMLTRLSTETKGFCQAEELTNIGQFADFFQNMAKSVVMGGDFRTFLNCLIHINEEGISEILPFRPGHKGLHLPEAIGLVVDSLREGETLHYVKKFGGKLTSSEQATLSKLPPEELAYTEERALRDINDYFKYFDEQKDELTEYLDGGGTLERYFVVLGEPRKERICQGLTGQALNQLRRGESPGARAASAENAAEEAEAPKKRGFFSRLFGG